MSDRKHPQPPPPASEPYEAPRLIVLGTLAELTRGTGAPGPDDDGDFSDGV